MANNTAIVQGAVVDVIIQPTWGTLDGSADESKGLTLDKILTDIQALLDRNYYTKTDVNSLLDTKQNVLTFDSVPTVNSDNPVKSGGVYTALAGKSDTGHTHDERYYTETETDTLLSGKSDTTHNHDSVYVKKIGDTMSGTLNLTPATGEGGEIHLNAAENDNTHGHIYLDNANGVFRVFAANSRDGTSQTGGNTEPFRVNTFEKTFGTGYAYLGSLNSTGGTISGTLNLTNRQDAAGTADNKPALIIGGTSSQSHIEIDDNEIMAKANGTTVSALYLNSNGGIVSIGSGGMSSSGNLIVSKAAEAQYNAKNTSVTVGTAPSSNTWLGSYNFRDNADLATGYIAGRYDTDRKSVVRILSRAKNASNNNVENYVEVNSYYDGTKNITTFSPIVSSPGAGTSYIAGCKGLSTGLFVKKDALNVDHWIPGLTIQTKGGGGWSIGNYNNENLHFVYGTKANIDSNTNTTLNRYIDTNGNYSGNAANVTGTVAVDHGGTGATTAANARTNLGITAIATRQNYYYGTGGMTDGSTALAEGRLYFQI